MQITLRDHPKLRARAAAAGFATVEEYVQHLVAVDVGLVDDSSRLSPEQWQRLFDDLLAYVETDDADDDEPGDDFDPRH